tara:strand:- start:606 stop:845 length:240 start_codon:yes stop_codon:yes gene_type:complete
MNWPAALVSEAGVAVASCAKAEWGTASAATIATAEEQDKAFVIFLKCSCSFVIIFTQISQRQTRSIITKNNLFSNLSNI